MSALGEKSRVLDPHRAVRGTVDFSGRSAARQRPVSEAHEAVRVTSAADVRRTLDGLRDELRLTLAREREDLARPSDDPVDHTGHHPAEAGTDLYLREWSLVTQRALERELAAVEDAMARLDHGTYGTCAECGRPIEPDRLAARPQAIRRAECEHRYRAHAPRTSRPGRR